MRGMLLVALLWSSAVVWTAVAGLSCMGDDGNPTDHWTGIKANNNHHMYYYAQASTSFVQSPYGVDQDVNGAIMQTVLPLYDPAVNSTLGYVMWNDAPPGDYSPGSYYAHSKGVLATDGTSGFWLTHSMPNWPDFPADGSPGVFPSDKYAQSMACVSVTTATINAISDTMRVNYPYVFAHNMPDDLSDQLNWMVALIARDKVADTNETVAGAPITTLAGVPYEQFAKSAKWGEDVWDDLIAPYYETPMYVETWISGSGGAMSSMCYNSTNPAIEKINEEYDVYQVNQILMPDGDNWSNTQDHSKWGVAKSTEQGNNQIFYSTAVCIGDMNRMCSQEKRGGGALCTQNAGLLKAFTDIIVGTETCYLKDPCSTSSPCYWCAMPSDLTYPPTFFPTNSPVNAADTNSGDNALNITDPKVFIGAIVGAALLLSLIIYISKLRKNRQNKTSLAAKDHHAARSSFEVEKGNPMHYGFTH